jgi:hypothetical protein
MPLLLVSIVRFVDESFPGFVECEFIDAFKQKHTLIDKVPIFSEQVFWSDSSYPQSGNAGCEILGRFREERGRELLRIKIARPWAMETVDGETQFIVNTSQVSEDPSS